VSNWKCSSRIQADRFGTGVAQSLRAHADFMRVQARQIAEEKAAKLGVKLIFPIAALALVYFTGFYRTNVFFIPVVAFALGYLIPDMWLTWRVSVRQRQLRRGLPDALDLLVICVEAGLGLDQALMKVAQDMKISHPELSEELQFVNLEMRIGKTRIDALRELARRTGLDDIKALVAMLIQTERFGTSIIDALRTYATSMRETRSQRAQEAAEKMAIKLIFPMIAFIFPAAVLVMAGPAFMSLYQVLAH